MSMQINWRTRMSNEGFKYLRKNMFLKKLHFATTIYIEKKEEHTNENHNCNLIFDELSGVLWQKG